MASRAQLVMEQGPRPGEMFYLDEPTLVLGRDPRNPIVIDHPQVSRRHARIVRRGDAWVIADLGSTNGTFVNGTPLSGPRVLERDDAVGLSEAVTLTFRVEDPEAHPQAPLPPSPRYRGPDWGATSVDAGAPASPAPYPGSPVATASQAEPRRDRTWLWIGAGCVVLLLTAACAAVLILGYLGMLPDILYELLQALGLI